MVTDALTYNEKNKKKKKKKLKFDAKSTPIAALGTISVIYHDTLHADGENHYITLNQKLLKTGT